MKITKLGVIAAPVIAICDPSHVKRTPGHFPWEEIGVLLATPFEGQTIWLIEQEIKGQLLTPAFLAITTGQSPELPLPGIDIGTVGVDMGVICIADKEGIEFLGNLTDSGVALLFPDSPSIAHNNHIYASLTDLGDGVYQVHRAPNQITVSLAMW